MNIVFILPVIIFALFVQAENNSGDELGKYSFRFLLIYIKGVKWRFLLDGALKNMLVTMKEMSDRIQILEEQNMKGEPSLMPSSYQCGYQPQWGAYHLSPADGPVGYDRMLFSREDEVWGLTNGLDINTGIFTSQLRGVYEISWSLIGRDEDTHVSSAISLYKNNVKLQAVGT